MILIKKMMLFASDWQKIIEAIRLFMADLMVTLCLEISSLF